MTRENFHLIQQSIPTLFLASLRSNIVPLTSDKTQSRHPSAYVHAVHRYQEPDSTQFQTSSRQSRRINPSSCLLHIGKFQDFSTLGGVPCHNLCFFLPAQPSQSTYFFTLPLICYFARGKKKRKLARPSRKPKLQTC